MIAIKESFLKIEQILLKIIMTTDTVKHYKMEGCNGEIMA